MGTLREWEFQSKAGSTKTDLVLSHGPGRAIRIVIVNKSKRSARFFLDRIHGTIG